MMVMKASNSADKVMELHRENRRWADLDCKVCILLWPLSWPRIIASQYNAMVTY